MGDAFAEYGFPSKDGSSDCLAQSGHGSYRLLYCLYDDVFGDLFKDALAEYGYASKDQSIHGLTQDRLGSYGLSHCLDGDTLAEYGIPSKDRSIQCSTQNRHGSYGLVYCLYDDMFGDLFGHVFGVYGLISKARLSYYFQVYVVQYYWSYEHVLEYVFGECGSTWKVIVM